MRQHGLAGTGLAGQHVQTGAESQLGALDQEEVFNAELAQHGPTCLATESDEIAPVLPGLRTFAERAIRWPDGRT